jgi:PHD/YefM family antitoxin component YafN of YafNO toxin-antitoxin module
MLEVQETHSLEEFVRDHKTHVDRIKETKTPEILTVDGRAEVVVLDADTFREILEKLYRVETVEALREGYEAVKRGDVVPVEEAFADIRKKYDL